MSDFGSLSHCIVDGDPSEIGRARRVRGGAFAVSTAVEIALVVSLLLWPLLTTAVLPAEHMAAPVPVFHPIEARPIVEQQQERPVTQRPHFGITMLQQPPAIPRHVFTGSDANLPPAPEIGSNPGSPLGNIDEIGSGSAPPLARPRANAPVVRGGDVMNALLLHRVQPEYPEPAKLLHLSGTVQLRAIIGVDGSVRNIEIVSGNPILANAAVTAVRQWKYQPTHLNGKPVEVETVVTVQFQMQQR